MSNDFAHLVSRANPATRQYQPASSGYPLSHSNFDSPYAHPSPQAMGPFFDNEGDMTDSAFGHPPAIQV
jgi:phospholipid-transporting ATPase